jgi:hypothetical protein
VDGRDKPGHDEDMKGTQWGRRADYCPPGGLCAMRGQQEQQFASEGSGMHIDPKECHPAMDYSEHQKTYKLFCKLTAWTIIGVVAVMALLYFFVA